MICSNTDKCIQAQDYIEIAADELTTQNVKTNSIESIIFDFNYFGQENKWIERTIEFQIENSNATLLSVRNHDILTFSFSNQLYLY